MELYNKYMNNEISIEEYIKSKVMKLMNYQHLNVTH